MPEVNLDRIVIRNFKTTGLAKPVAFDLDWYGIGLHFLKGINQANPRLGSNGAGKTTIWDALCWVLFGRTPDGLRNPDITPWTGERPTWVILHFRIDGLEHELQRWTNPSNKLMLDNESAVQDMIDQLIGMNFDLFTNAVLYGQGRPLFLDKAPGEKMAMFIGALDLGRWDARSEIAAGDTKKLEGVAADLQLELTSLETRCAQLHDQIVDLRKRVDEFEKERTVNIQTVERERKAIKEELEKAELAYNDHDLAYDSAGTELKALDTEIDRLEDDIHRLDAERDECVNKVRRVEADVGFLQEAVAVKGKSCPTCGQLMTTKHREMLRGRLKSSLQILANAVSPELDKQAEDLASRLEIAKRARVEFRKKEFDAQRGLDYYTPIVANLKARSRMAWEIVENKSNDANPYTEQMMDARREFAKLSREADAVHLQLVETVEQSERTRFWIKGFKDVRLYVLGDVLDELEWVTAAMLEEVGLVGWAVQYEVERETQKGTTQRGLTTFIKSPLNKEPVRFECWSGGEAQRLRLVGALALADVLLAAAGVKIDLEIFDEPSRSLSDEGIDDLIETLAERAGRDGKQIFYTEHLIPESSKFTTTTTITRTIEGSTIT